MQKTKIKKFVYQYTIYRIFKYRLQNRAIEVEESAMPSLSRHAGRSARNKNCNVAAPTSTCERARLTMAFRLRGRGRRRAGTGEGRGEHFTIIRVGGWEVYVY